VPAAANVLSLQSGTTAQEFRVYGTTTGPKYVALYHNATDAVLEAQSGDLILRAASSNYWRVAASTGRLQTGANFGFAHGTSALATNATEGFFHLQSCAGTPNGTPASIPTGQVPLIIDSTNRLLYAYLGGAWKRANIATANVTFD
jgi:hypothetical protein